MLARIRMVAVVAGLTGGLLLAGCTSALSLFDPAFLTALGLGSQVAGVPGDAPSLLVAVENNTDQILEAVVSYRTEDSGVITYSTRVAPGERTAQALICPIDELTMGDVSDITAIGALIRLGNGDSVDPYIEVEPLGVVLKDSVNYNCGDAITFSVQTSGASRSGYRIFAYIQRAGGGG